VRGGFGFGKQTLPNRATYWLSFVGAILLGVIGVHLFANSGRGPSQKLSVRSYATVAGQQATVTLADGSRALLGPATTLSITTQPSDASMDVHVIGQALFTVAHSQRRPFRVHTGHAVARVLGTTFMVRQYTTDHVARVVVTEGRVSLSSARGAAARTTSRVLLASMMGTVNDSGNVQVTPNIVAEDYTAWTTGHVVFNKTPAREAVVELSRVYGVDIRITDSTLATQQLTWTIPVAKQSLSVVLVSLVGLLDAHTVQTGRVITLVPGRSASRRPVRPITPSASERQYGK
jgi:transmembrane sensor